jgi:hypothetical protein
MEWLERKNNKIVPEADSPVNIFGLCVQFMPKYGKQKYLKKMESMERNRR